MACKCIDSYKLSHHKTNRCDIKTVPFIRPTFDITFYEVMNERWELLAVGQKANVYIFPLSSTLVIRCACPFS